MSSSGPATRRLRVLIADDEADLRLGLWLLVASLGAEVRDAESGERALEILATWTPHVLVSDVLMGQVSGLDLLRHVRSHLPQVKVLMITGHGARSTVAAIRHGASAVLEKPFENQELLAAVKHLGRAALTTESPSP